MKFTIICRNICVCEIGISWLVLKELPTPCRVWSDNSTFFILSIKWNCSGHQQHGLGWILRWCGNSVRITSCHNPSSRMVTVLSATSWILRNIPSKNSIIPVDKFNTWQNWGKPCSSSTPTFAFYPKRELFVCRVVSKCSVLNSLEYYCEK